MGDFTYDWEYWIDPEDNFLYVPPCERITGYPAQQFLDDTSLLERIVHPDDLNKMMNHLHIERKVDHETFHSLDFRIIHRDGHTLSAQPRLPTSLRKRRATIGKAGM